MHYTHQSDSVTDPWMLRQVALDTNLGIALAGAMFAGVRILAPLTPSASVHLTADGVHHPVGECQWCVSTSAWPAATPDTTLPATIQLARPRTQPQEMPDAAGGAA